MRSFLVIAIITLASQLSAQDWSDKTRVLPDELRKVPIALYIIHVPNPNYPELASQKDSKGFQYVWKHSTKVYSPDKDLQVIQAGSYIWYNEEGWKKNVDFNRNKFAKLFKCPKGKIKAGVHYTFEKNYRWGNNLYGGDAMWYVLAKDDEGNIYKGIGLLETEGEFSPQSTVGSTEN